MAARQCRVRVRGIHRPRHRPPQVRAAAGFGTPAGRLAPSRRRAGPRAAGGPRRGPRPAASVAAGGARIQPVDATCSSACSRPPGTTLAARANASHRGAGHARPRDAHRELGGRLHRTPFRARSRQAHPSRGRRSDDGRNPRRVRRRVAETRSHRGRVGRRSPNRRTKRAYLGSVATRRRAHAGPVRVRRDIVVGVSCVRQP